MCPSRGSSALLAASCIGLPLLSGLGGSAHTVRRHTLVPRRARRHLRGGELPPQAAPAVAEKKQEYQEVRYDSWVQPQALQAELRSIQAEMDLAARRQNEERVKFLEHHKRRVQLKLEEALVAQDKAQSAGRDMIVDVADGHEHECTFIYLHGYSRSGSEYLDQGRLGFCMPWNSGGDRAPGMRAVLPTAPLMKQPWGDIEPSWYEYVDPYRNQVGDLASLEDSRERLGNLICEEVARLDGAGRRVFVGGASQGCIMALDVYLQLAPRLRLGGFVGNIGFVPSDACGFPGADDAISRLLADTGQKERPLWLQMATDDNRCVPWWGLAKPSMRRLEGGALPGLVAREVSGRGHGIEEWEAHIVNDFFKAHMPEMYTFK